MPERISDSLKARIAMARMEPLLKGGSMLSYSEIIEQFRDELDDGSHGTIAERTVQAAFREAFERGLVTLQKKPIIRSYTRRHDLEEALKHRYHQTLMEAVVADIERDPGRDDDLSNYIHEQLGHALATYIDETAHLIRSGDVIGLGSGRGVRNVVSVLTELQRPPALKVDEVTLVSLTGSLYAGTAEEPKKARSELLFDADTHVALLSQYFSGLVHTRPILQRIAHPKSERQALLAKTWLGPDQYKLHRPNVVVAGVGTLGPGHRFWQEIKNAHPSLYLDPVRKPLKQLVDHVEQLAARNRGLEYCPVADICNRLFLVRPPRALGDEDMRIIDEDIDGLIDEINACLLTVTKTQLSEAGKILLVAGTPRKVQAIHALLNHRIAKIHVLCTDVEAAKLLLRLPKEAVEQR